MADQRPDQAAHHGRCTWEEAIRILRRDPRHQKLIFDAYLTDDNVDNCERFARSEEFSEILNLLKRYRPTFRDVLDIPAGNGIATYALANAGYRVTAVEPDSSDTVGRGAIRAVFARKDLHAEIVDAYGEQLPMPAAAFDVVFVRQGLHHARDLVRMLREYFRVLRAGGVLLACREHVVDDREASLRAFLESQPDHQLYGGENAFTLSEYRSAVEGAGFELCLQIAPYDSPINLHPNTLVGLGEKILASRPGSALRLLLPDALVVKIGMAHLRRARLPGRLYSFLAIKPH